MTRATTYLRRWSVLALLGITAATSLALRVQPAPHAPGLQLVKRALSPAARAHVEQAYGKLPLTFIANRGQLDRHVAYFAPGRDKSLYFTAGGVTFALAGKKLDHRRGTTEDRRPVVMPASFTVGRHPADRTSDRWALKLEFVGARSDARPVGREASPTVVSYFKGPRSQWHTDVGAYASVAYNELWPGIDLVYAGSYERLKSTFEVKPGADPSQIRLAYHGASSLQITPEGGLAISTPAGSFTDETPIAFQEIDGKRVPVEASYVLDEPTASTLNAQGSTLPVRGYHFRLGAYDHSRPLMLDPVVVLYGGFFGGNGDDIGYAIAVDSAGNAYITGSTTSDTGLPVKVAPGKSFSGHDDAFVAKLSADGTKLLYCGYIGGNQDDDAYAIAVDSAGNAYVVGDTSSSEATFPVTVGPGLKFKSGPSKGFISKVSADGTKLLYSGFIGGSNEDHASGVAVDAAGNAYVAGFTNSSDFPVKVGPGLKYGGGPYDVFVARVNAGGTGFDWAGYIGGAGDDEIGNRFSAFESAANPIALDKDGNVYVTGSTTSPESSFPVKGGPGLTYSGAGVQSWGDAFVAKVKADGSSLVYCGYLGGSNDDRGNAIAVDSAGSAYVGGITFSSSFPVKVGPQVTYPGGTLPRGFVTKVTPDGSALVYSGFIGGAVGGSAAGGDRVTGIAVNSAGNAYVVGSTTSYEPNSPIVAGGTFPAFRGPGVHYEGANTHDVLLGEVRADGTGYVYLGYIGIDYPGHNPANGGRPFTLGIGIAVDGAGNAYVTGRSTGTSASPDVYPPQPSGSDLTNPPTHGANDVLIAKIATKDLVALSLPASAAPGTKVTGTVTLDVPAPANGELIRISSGNRAVATPDADTVTIPAGKQTATFTITAATSPASASTTITVSDDTYAAPAATLTVK